MFVLNGQPLPIGVAFIDQNGIQRPSNWLELATPEERIAAGVQEVPDPPDSRFYDGYDEHGLPIPKNHGELCKFWIGQTRQAANNLLRPTDWIIIREADNGKPADPTLKTWREDIRLATGAKVTAIRETVDTPALAAYITGADYPVWPRDPYSPVPADAELIDVDGIESVSSGEAV